MAIRSIRSGPDLRTAHSRSTEHTRLLMESDAQLPPIIVHRSTLKLIDGAHRLRVAMARKQDVVPARYFDGSEADAFVLAVRANVAHGLPLSLNERKAAALRLILEHPCWSDRMIASATGVSHTTVSTERQRATGRAGRLHSRVGKDGKVRPMATDKGRRIAAKLIRDSPTMSLREISRMAGISTGTVRDVRDRLNRGVDPVPGHADPADTPGSPKVSSATSIGADNGTSSHIQQAILRSLQRDPALRFSDRGRSVLRLVSGIVNSRAGAEQTLLDAPSHCHCHLAKLARANAQFWSNLADELEA
ncbi:ParB/RepB/Spo0J family partition protein [Nocardia sp. CNY236]|uniref:ParB/RepB/Spo0J family partition protein n=1 Tax=Nocardia sp. CNY236 TaxID=1169152 RepID=UPI0018CBB147|nr:ParB/RepB/Spo0J family partition protein [Nocardia sp. CNY236]